MKTRPPLYNTSSSTTLYGNRAKGTHLYEALYYVWGGSDKPRSISIDKYDLPITANLHTALSRLRGRSIAQKMSSNTIRMNFLHSIAASCAQLTMHTYLLQYPAR